MSIKERILKLKDNFWFILIILLKDLLGGLGSILEAIQPTAPWLISLTEKLTAMELDWYNTAEKVFLCVIIMYWKSYSDKRAKELEATINSLKSDIDSIVKENIKLKSAVRVDEIRLEALRVRTEINFRTLFMVGDSPKERLENYLSATSGVSSDTYGHMLTVAEKEDAQEATGWVARGINRTL